MTEVENFIFQFEDQQREILLHFHKLLTSELNLTAKLRYKIPFYYNKSWICYLSPDKKGKVELAFTRGNELSNSQGILDNKDRKQVYGIVFSHIDDIPEKELNEVLQEAVLLDETIPYASKRKK